MERIRIAGERVTLRPLALDELDTSLAAREAADRTVHPVKPDREQLRARFERSGLLRDGALDLAIDVGGVRIGEIQTYRPLARELPPGAYEVGIMIDRPELRGRGYGSEAVELLLDWLFTEAGATRVHMPTVEGNAAMRAVLERLGFRAEGTVHDHGLDFVFYVVTRDAWRARR
ncbi:MAG TPA: GNAT family N-acetyltransferase [Gaiellaceae bacterium]|nr:GNAT family N-acetyltransferase [Gaiellaceae bacterium]